MSLATTIARAESRAAGGKWKDHRTHCPDCHRRSFQRRGDWCSAGAELRVLSLEADRALARERELDRQPAPGQAPLF